MIRTVADLINNLVEKERESMDSLKIEHAPTIGSMYEGLSEKLLKSAIPEGLNLKVTSGFITDCKDNMSGQIDIMIVSGDGKKIPNTDLDIYDVDSVLAVFEIKKDMNYSNMTDAFAHLAKVWELFFNNIQFGDSKKSLGVDKIDRDYATIFGRLSEGFYNRQHMQPGDRLIYDTLIYERMQPIKIILSYGGYKTEKGMREALFKFISAYQSYNKIGYGVTAYPNLIMTNNVSVIKCNGSPYTPISTDGFWDFLASTSVNPMIVLLEIIWTKISNEFDIGMPWGEDLKIERLNMFLKARPKVVEGKAGWEIAYYKTIHSSDVVEYDWEPIEINETEVTLLLSMAKTHRLNLKDVELVEFCRERGYLSPLEAIQRLIDGRILALSRDKKFAGYITEKCSILVNPDGKSYAADYAEPRYQSWIIQKVK